jgi:glycosyltransferase involved in cell wall biosynthesis
MDLSIVIPSRNTPPALLVRAILSVIDSIDKSFEYEIIVVDDASVEPIPLNGSIHSLGPSARLRIIRASAPLGIGPARNLGTENSTGQYITFIDSDDVLKPGSLTTMMGAASPHRVIFADHEVCSETKEDNHVRSKAAWVPIFERYRSSLDDPTFFCNFIVFPFLLPRSLFSATGGYPDAGYAGEHVGLYAALAANRKAEFVHIPLPLYEYRLRPSSHSNSNMFAHHLYKGRQLSAAITAANLGIAEYSGIFLRHDKQPTIYLPSLNGTTYFPKWATSGATVTTWSLVP